MSHQPLTDDELDAMRDVSPQDFKNLRESYRALRRVLHIAEAIRDDARAHSQRALEEKREAEATHKTDREHWERMLAAQQLGTSEMRRALEAEIASLRSEVAARAVDAERRTQNDRSALLHMAGSIAAGLLAQPALAQQIAASGLTSDPDAQDAAIAMRAVAMARAILAEVGKP